MVTNHKPLTILGSAWCTSIGCSKTAMLGYSIISIDYDIKFRKTKMLMDSLLQKATAEKGEDVSIPDETD